MNNKNEQLKICAECGSQFNQTTSSMSNLCPECSHWLYGYESCQHEFRDGRCSKCNWDGSTSDYINKIRSSLPIPPLTAELEKKRIQLITDIYRFFPDIILENEKGLFHARLKDDHGDPRNNLPHIRRNPNIPWQALADTDLAYYNDILYWLSPEAFHAYLPAFLVWYLKYLVTNLPHEGAIFEQVIESVINAEVVQKNRDLFDENQIDTIAQFLELLNDINEPDVLLTIEEYEKGLQAWGLENN